MDFLELAWSGLKLQAVPHLLKKRVRRNVRIESKIKKFRRIDTLHKLESIQDFSPYLPFNRQGWSKELYEQQIIGHFLKYLSLSTKTRDYFPNQYRRLYRYRISRLKNEYIRRYLPMYTDESFFRKHRIEVGQLGGHPVVFSFYYFYFLYYGPPEVIQKFLPPCTIGEHGDISYASHVYKALASWLELDNIPLYNI